jgi:hypothetical protein
MFKRIVLMLAVAALFTTCEETDEMIIPDITGHWIHSSSDWTWTPHDGSAVITGDSSYNVTNPLFYDMMLEITADTVYAYKNDPYSTGYDLDFKSYYLQDTDTTMTIDDDDGYPELVPYFADQSTFIIYFEGEEERGDIVYDTYHIETFIPYSGTFPPPAWSDAEDNPVLGYWYTISESWTRDKGGEVESGSYTFDPEGDSYLWEEILEFTDDSLRFWENDFASSSYSYDAGAYEIEGDELHLWGFEDDDMPGEMWLPFSIEGGEITVYFDDEREERDEEDNPVLVTEHRESVLAPYVNFPPVVWLDPIIDTYEPDDTYTDATPITVDGDAQIHELEDADQDWFVFTAVAGQRYAFEITGDLDSQVRIYPDPPGDNPQHPTWMHHDDDTEREEWTCYTAGTYYFVVEAAYDPSGEWINEDPTGFYAISLTTTDPVNSITVSLNEGPIGWYEEPYSRLQAAYLETGVEPIPDGTFYAAGGDEWGSFIIIMFKGQAVGTYDVPWTQGLIDETDNFNIFYNVSDSEQYGLTHSGSVTVTAFGAVGDVVEGTYEAVIAVFDEFHQPTEVTATVSGTFRVKRSADGTSMDD